MSNFDDENFDDFSHNDDDELRQLIRSIQLSQKFFLHFAVCNQVPKQNELIKQIKAALPDKKIEIINFKESVTDLLGEINQRLKGKKCDAIFIQGLFYSIKSDGKGNENKLIHNLNITRDRFGKELSFPMYLWLPEYAFAKIARNAPDFFSVRSGSYYFALSAEKITESIFQETTISVLQDANLTFEEKQKRIQTLESLLHSYQNLQLIKRDKQIEGKLLFDLGNILYFLSNFRKAIKYYEEVLKISYEIGDRRNEGSSKGNLGNAHLSLGEYRKAIEYYEIALKISQEFGNRQLEGNYLNNLGNAYRNLGEYLKAIEFYEEALKISRQIGDRLNEGSIIGNLGNAYRNLGEYQKAIGYFEKALKVSRQIRNRQGESNHLGNMGIVYEKLGKYLNAIDYYEEALKISREIGFQQGEGNHLGNMGRTYDSLGEKEKARDYYLQSIAILEAIESSKAEIFRKNLKNLEYE